MTPRRGRLAPCRTSARWQDRAAAERHLTAATAAEPDQAAEARRLPAR